MEATDMVDTEEEDSHVLEAKRESGSEEIDEAHNSPRKRTAVGSSPRSGRNGWKKVEERDIPRKRMRIRHPLRLPDDGHLWQQYGQKRIKGTEYMRKYYRCGLFKMLGCPAKRTVDFHKDNLRKAAVSHLAKHNHPVIPIRPQNPLTERSLQPIATTVGSLVPPSTTSLSPNMSPVIPSTSADISASFPKVLVRICSNVSEDPGFSNRSPSPVTESLKSSPPSRFNSLEAVADAQFHFESNTGRATGNVGGLLSGEALLKALLVNIGLSKTTPVARMDSCGSPPSQGSQRDAHCMERGRKVWPGLEGRKEGGTTPEDVTNVTQTGVMSPIFLSMLSQMNADGVKQRQMREEVDERDRVRVRQEAEEREEREARKMREVSGVQQRNDTEERERDWERERERAREVVERQDRENSKMGSEREAWARREEERWQSVDAGWLGLAMTSKIEVGRKTDHITKGSQENGKEKDFFLGKLSGVQGGCGHGSRKRIAEDDVNVEKEDSHGGSSSPRKKMFCLSKGFELRSVKSEQFSLKEDSRELEGLEEKSAIDDIPEEMESLQEREETAGSGQSTIAQDDPASEEDTENRQEGDKIVRRRRIHHRLGIPYDGYFWEKYGQKHIKGTRYMRNYYRCAMFKKTECPAKRTIDYHKDTFHCERTAYMAHHSHPMLSLHRRGLQGMQAMAAIHNQSLNENFNEDCPSTMPSTTSISPISPMDTPMADLPGSPSSEGSHKSASGRVKGEGGEGGVGGDHVGSKERGNVAVELVGEREPAFERELLTGAYALMEKEVLLGGKTAREDEKESEREKEREREKEKEKENWKNLDPGWLCLAMDITPSGLREVEGTCNENGRVGVC